MSGVLDARRNSKLDSITNKIEQTGGKSFGIKTDITTDTIGEITPNEIKAILNHIIWYRRPQKPETKKRKNNNTFVLSNIGILDIFKIGKIKLSARTLTYLIKKCKQ